MASPADTYSSCSSQRGASRKSWNGRERDVLHSRCRSLPPRRTCGRDTTSSGYRSVGGSAGSGRSEAEEELRPTGQQEELSRVTRDCSRMRVGVRIRPAFQSEVLPFKKRSGGYQYRCCVSVSQRRKTSIRSNTGMDVGCQGAECTEDERSTACVELRMPNGRQRSFAFDYAFDATCQQREIYERYGRCDCKQYSVSCSYHTAAVLL